MGEGVGVYSALCIEKKICRISVTGDDATSRENQLDAKEDLRNTNGFHKQPV